MLDDVLSDLFQSVIAGDQVILASEFPFKTLLLILIENGGFDASVSGGAGPPAWQAQNLRRTRDLLLPRLLSGQVELIFGVGVRHGSMTSEMAPRREGPSPTSVT